MINLDDKSLANFISDNEVCMVMFGATWCGPCKLLKPKVAELGLSNVAYADIQTCKSEAMSAGIMSVPTLVVYRGGKEVARAHRLTEEILSEIRS